MRIFTGSLPTSPPDQIRPDAVFAGSGDLLLAARVSGGIAHLRVARYLGAWLWHPVGTLVWDSGVADSDATVASKTAGLRFERLVGDDVRSFYAIVQVGGAGVVDSAELFSCKLGGR